MKRASKLFSLVLPISVLVVGSVALSAPSEFRGYEAINSLLRQRLMEPGSKFELGIYLGQPVRSIFNSNLTDLLGSYSSGAMNSKFQNGAANAANVLLWHVAVSGLARDISRLCVEPAALPVQPRFKNIVDSLCGWPAASAKEEKVLLKYWFALMGYRADQAEYEAWRDFFLQTYANAGPAETIAAMTLAIGNNPYFLLQ